MLETFIPGIPRPQGSKNAYKRGNRVVMVEANKYLPEWRQALYEAFTALQIKFEDAITVEATFYIPRAKSNKRQHATTKPDADKLQRALGDSLTKAGTIKDDSYITRWIVDKQYADDTEPGLKIKIYDTP